MAKLIINEQKKLGKIHEEIYGHFSEHLGRCIYEGLYVGENSEIPNVNGIRSDVVAALKDMKIPVLRWPGGCFADEYHWKDGIGPKENRKKMINTHWGGLPWARCRPSSDIRPRNSHRASAAPERGFPSALPPRPCAFRSRSGCPNPRRRRSPHRCTSPNARKNVPAVRD